ncbi:MAG: DeoR family transcriptional regulator, partial [Cypionkella sp.]
MSRHSLPRFCFIPVSLCTTTEAKRNPSELMDVQARHLAIIDKARLRGRVLVEDLAEEFSVSVQTIRKDLNEICH